MITRSTARLGEYMAEKKIHLRIITPIGIKADEQVDMVILRCVGGDMGVLPEHEALSAVLDIGALRIINDGAERRLAVFGGLAEVQDDVLTVLTSVAEWPEDIDLALAEEERARFLQRIQETEDATEIQHDQLLLRRSLVRIEVRSDTLLSGQEPAEE